MAAPDPVRRTKLAVTRFAAIMFTVQNRSLLESHPVQPVKRDEFDDAVSGASVKEDEGEGRLVIMAPTGAEVYVDDERHGSIGRSGRFVPRISVSQPR